MRRHLAIHTQLTLLGLGLVTLLMGCDGGSKASPNAGTGGKPASTTAGGSTSSAGSPNATGSSGAGNSAGSAGAAAELGCAATTPEEGFVDVPVTDPSIRYVGRVNKTAEAVAFAFPAVQIQTVFDGDAIDMKLRDHGLLNPVATNYYWIIIDGVQKKLQVCQACEVYPLARNLGAGPHTLTIIKRTESGPGGQANTGKDEFLGFRVRTGTALSAAAKPARLMEFVGDSITCGYGNEVSTTDPDSFKFTSVNEDAWNAYGAITARAFNADYVAVAASGRGVIRNYSGFAGALVPAIYETTLHEDSSAPAWAHATYSPDVVVVNLGTNDFSPGIALDQMEVHRATFKQAYIDFLTRIRAVHAEANIVAVVGPMMGDSWPAGYNAWTSIQADVKAAVDARNAASDANVHYFALAPQSSPYGEDWHPTVATHQKMADALVPFIAGIRGW